MTDKLQTSYALWVESGKVRNSPTHNALALDLLRLTERLADGKFIKDSFLHQEAIGDAHCVIPKILDNYAPENGRTLRTFAKIRIKGSFQDTSRRQDMYGRTVRKAIGAYKTLMEENLSYAALRERMEAEFTKQTIRDAEALVYSETLLPPAQHIDKKADTMHSAHKDGIHRMFMKVVNTLPDRQKEAVVMKWGGNQNEEIAAFFNVSASAIHYRLKKAQKRMKQKFLAYGITANDL